MSEAIDGWRRPARRLKVVGPAIAIAGGVAALSATSVPPHAPELWASTMAGPFAGLWATSTWGPADAFGWAIGCGSCAPAGPDARRARRWTASR